MQAANGDFACRMALRYLCAYNVLCSTSAVYIYSIGVKTVLNPTPERIFYPYIGVIELSNVWFK